MKNIMSFFLLTIMILQISSMIIFSQEQDPIIKRLDSPKYGDRIDAIMMISEDNLIQYASILEERVFLQKEPFLIYSILETLEDLNSPNLYGIAKKFIDTIGYYPNVNKEIYDLLKAKVTATGILIRFNDYSTINYVWEIIERDKPNNKVTPGLIGVLYNLLYIPQFEERAKQELLYIYNSEWFKNANDNILNPRPAILGSLTKRYGLGLKDILINSFLYDPESSINPAALRYLIDLNYTGLDTLLIYKLYMDSDSIMRPQVALTIATRLNTPERYFILKNYRPPIQNEHREQGIATYVAGVKPKQPVTENTVQSIDTTASFIDDLYEYTWLGDLTFSNELKTILTTAKTNLQNGDSLACREQIKTFQDSVDYVYKDSLNTDPRFVTLEGWKFLHWNAQYILDRLPEPQTNPNLLVNLKNSQGTQIPASSVKYYDTTWKDAVDNGDGTFTVITTKPNVSVRLFYEYASQTVNNVPAQNNTYTFHTVNTQVELENSNGELIDEGTVKYYAGAWRDFGTTVNGVASKELLPVNYNFRMTYEYGSIDKQQDISANPTVVFQTVNAAVQLQNSLGNLIDQGRVQYYAGAWRTFGTTVNGVTSKELLPNNYSFRMTYEYVSKDMQQDLNINPIVTFSTVLCTVQVKDQNNQPLNNADVKYYSLVWQEIGLTLNGEVTKELLPANLTFRATLGAVHQDVQQDLSVNNVVQIQLTINN